LRAGIENGKGNRKDKAGCGHFAIKGGRFFMPFLKGGTPMYFTEGQLLEYERMMQEKPGYNRRVIKTMKERDCRNCKHFDESCNKCSKDKCDIFDD
jgi:hypothetical protein